MAKSSPSSAGRRPSSRKAALSRWRKTFLAELAVTSNVSSAARKAGIDTSTAYDARRDNPDFYRQWLQAGTTVQTQLVLRAGRRSSVAGQSQQGELTETTTASMPLRQSIRDHSRP